ncbi:hypothetical protein [Subtercola boreus]|uniref:hypothetical protein n=1 Tax=Subtercola boreus TaxID=120213 RepID=UPI0011C03604|nr:hypothetical protein [Subtercola boreus]
MQRNNIHRRVFMVAAGCITAAALGLTGAVSASAAPSASQVALGGSPLRSSVTAVAVVPPGPPTVLYTAMFPGRDSEIFLETVQAGSYGSAKPEQVSYVYDLNDDNVWRKPVIPVSPGATEFSILARDGIVDGQVNTIRLKARAVIGGRVYDSAPSAPVSMYVFGNIDFDYQLKTVVAGDAVTFSWDVRSILHGQRATFEFTDSVTGQYRPVDAVGSVTVSAGFGATVTGSLLVTGESVDSDSRFFSTTATTGPASSGAPFTQTPAPTIVGTPLVGSVLTARAGTWKPLPVSFSYQWNRNGTPIAGATSGQYTLVPDDAAATITVSVTGRTPSGTSATLLSQPTAAVAAKVITGDLGLLFGTAALGQTLFVPTPNLNVAGAAISYQWLRNGIPIAGDTRSRHTVTRADVGYGLSVTVSARKTGYTGLTETSYQTDPIAPAAAD